MPQPAPVNSAPLRWGILGTARIARKNWQAIHHSGNGVLTAVASRDRSRAAAFIAECQSQVPVPVPPRPCGSYEELLASPDVDAVYVPLPTGLRKEWVIRAAGAGKHVVCEKPCAVSVADLEAMTAACRENGVQFMDGVMFVHSARMERMRTLITEAKALGEVRRVTSQFSFRGDDAFFEVNTRVNSKLEPHGCLGDLGWYSIVFALEVLGERLPLAVTARLHGVQHHQSSPHPIATEFSAELRYGGGVTASFYNAFLTGNQQWAHVSGSHGQLHLHDFVLPFFGCESVFETRQPEFSVTGCQFNMEPHLQRIIVPEYSNNHPTAQEARLFRSFASQVATGVLEDCWPQRSLNTQRILEACLASAAADGAEVRLGT